MASRPSATGFLVFLLLSGTAVHALAASPERPSPPPPGLVLTIERTDTPRGAPEQVAVRWTLANTGSVPVTVARHPGFRLDEQWSRGEGLYSRGITLPPELSPPASPDLLVTLSPGEILSGDSIHSLQAQGSEWTEVVGVYTSGVDGSSIGRPTWRGGIESRPLRIDLQGDVRRPCLEPEPEVARLNGLLTEVAPGGEEPTWVLALESPVCIRPPRAGYLGVFRERVEALRLVLDERPFEALRPFHHRHVSAVGVLTALPREDGRTSVLLRLTQDLELTPRPEN